VSLGLALGTAAIAMTLLGGRITAVSPYTARLFVHQYLLRTPEDLDATFAGWVREAFRVGEGDHLLEP
jgi:hypothetical protein